ncbi:MAG: nuclear transport factor 2 family protein [Thiohalobacterales bacterium]|nr:nuclear transport factor 2 family protein [Thiohalobacterales bacterium]
MEDARLVENLIYLYAERIDNGDLAGVAELFQHGEIVSTAHNTRFSGVEEVLGLYQMSCRIYDETGTPLTKHLTTNVIVEVQDKGETASARSYYTVLQATEALPLQAIISGRYHDQFSKRDGRWCFSRREMFVDLLGDCSAHLLYDASAL